MHLAVANRLARVVRALVERLTVYLPGTPLLDDSGRTAAIVFSGVTIWVGRPNDA